ncbi:TetR/AcrR family transcriptional regulator [Rhizobium halophytocola]|uniref:AcrR family transcriptional regulator n=1 Tax=Rhizobium halophytocola TaxID=735519 RepID=A0ABS4DYM1_9HYPH|nr:TetR/AcrR family transcriptional regulator [Rhizobium halophytocola]MBP1850785.1 AcrR family transcriptional regulator [Rhizobium halophytocola]
MSTIRRKKQPDKVRRDLLDAAARMAVQRGVADVTVDAVCQEAGVTKGAFFHHYQSKAALVAAVFEDLIARFEVDLAARMSADIEPHGRFTRAYLAAVTVPGEAGSEPLWAALCVSALADSALRRGWGDWLDGKLAEHREAGDLALRIVRAAADGLWLDTIAGTPATPQELAEITKRLRAMTLEDVT